VSTQPEALRLANDLDRTLCVKHGLRDRNAADELRRLHSVNADLLEALRLFAGDNVTHTEGERMEAARAAIARAEEVRP
jgi:hypothetical protein